MTIQVFPKTNVFLHNGAARNLLEQLRAHADQLQLASALLFCDFPLFREERELLAADFVILSPHHGVIVISTGQRGDENEASRLEAVFSQIFSRLIKYPRLRASRTTLKFKVEAILWLPERSAAEVHGVSEIVRVGWPALVEAIHAQCDSTALIQDTFDELVSVLDGSKALSRPPDRDVQHFGPASKVLQIPALEEEIRRFDRDQRVGYMTEVAGTQRIRGLAGSGKTVVLAMKAAITSIKYPEARIAFTFYTKSLYQHVKQLITRFYRLHEDRDPDWNQIRVMHAWGGATTTGFYSYVAGVSGAEVLTFGAAKAFDPVQPFAFACRRLLETGRPSSLFDFVFVDEAQDFPPEFLRLALAVAEEERVVVAYDVLQTIFDVETPTAGSLFGTDARGEPTIAFDEDIVLHKCYRNPRDVLICAHAIGFGIYSGSMVQTLESKEHWVDFGYQVADGELVSGSHVRITRPPENSPSSISSANSVNELIAAWRFNQPSQEVDFVCKSIVDDIRQQGVSPEDILVISPDDRNTKRYMALLTIQLAAVGVAVHNHQDDSYGLRDFQSKGKVTLSTVYKAKGNEAYVVYILGIDALFFRPTARQRNIAFTAMTRTKGWLRITGVGAAAQAFCDELNAAKLNCPDLKFVYPSPEQLVVMKRDLLRAQESDIDEVLARLDDQIPDDEIEDALVKKLKEVRARQNRKQKKFKAKSY